MSTMRVLHIVNWYPNMQDPHEAPFIHRHVQAMARTCQSEVWHIAVRQHKKFFLTTRGPHADRTLLLNAPLRTWYIIEWITTLLVLWAWMTRKRSLRYDMVNFYIAYPLCTRLRLLRTVIRRPMMMMEQWSGYHFEFGTTSSGLNRARRIFRHGIPVVCVSGSLANDIRRFAGVSDLPCPVVPNVVDLKQFTCSPDDVHEPDVYFAMAGWRRPKRPEIMIEALALLRSSGVPAHLRLAGDGPEMPAVKALIEKHALHDRVTLLGRLDPASAAMEMRKAFALWHCSDYETFSVVCAEALCCGAPVIASNVGGIPSFVNSSNGVLVPSNDAETWADAVAGARERLAQVDRQALASTAQQRFGAIEVGEQLVTLFEQRMAGSPVAIAP